MVGEVSVASSNALKGARILAIPSAVGLAHLTRLALIARELAQVGAEVAFAFRDPKNDIFKRMNFPVLPVADVIVADFTANVYDAYEPPLIEQCIQDELAAIRKFKPDVVLGDFRPTAAISARLAQVPYVSVVDGCMTNYFNPVSVMLTETQYPTRFKWATSVTEFIQHVQKRSLARHFRAAARNHGVKRLSSLFDFLEGDLTLISDLPDFNPLLKLPDHFHYIGPLIWEGLDSLPYALPPTDPDRALIYATVGNTGQEQFMDLVMQALGGDEAYQVVLTTGAYLSLRLPTAANIYVARFIPGSQILPQAQAMIHCGGSGSTYQALLYGAPTIVVPFGPYQRINAWLAQKNHVGIPLSPVRLTPEQLKEALAHLLADQEIAANVRRFQASWKKDNGPRVAVLRIADFLAQKSGRG